MPSTRLDRRAGPVGAAIRRDHELIARAAKRTDLAGTALESAAGDLNDVLGEDGNALEGLAEVVLEQAGRLSSRGRHRQPQRPGSALTLPSRGVDHVG